MQGIINYDSRFTFDKAILKFSGYVVLLTIIAIFNGCTPQNSPTDSDTTAFAKQVDVPNYQIPYNLKIPSKVHFMESELVEISALSLSEKKSQLVCITDEIGRVFFINKNSGKITAQFDFDKKGDYEGIEYVNGKYYMLESKGTIHVYDPKTKETEIINTFLTTENDVEGLSYWSKRNRLMLACKGSPDGKHQFKKARAVYDFDLVENELKKKPMFLVTHDQIREFITAKKTNGISEKLGKHFQIKDALDFAPSALAVHPTTQNIYMLSTVGRTLFVVDETGKILHIEFLDTDIYTQPEGIVFDKDGTLYISNEGRTARGSVLKFKQRK